MFHPGPNPTLLVFLLCSQFGRNAVHAAMAGKTDVVIELWYNVFVHAPIPNTIATRRRMARMESCGPRCWQPPANQHASNEPARSNRPAGLAKAASLLRTGGTHNRAWWLPPGDWITSLLNKKRL